MDKQRIDVPGAEELSPGPGAGGTSSSPWRSPAPARLAGSTLLARKAYGQGYGQGGGGDVDIANFALTLEYLEQEFYGLALDAGVLTGDALCRRRGHLRPRVAARRCHNRGCSRTPARSRWRSREFVFPPEALASQAAILETAATLEPVGVGAYLGAAPMIQAAEILAAAGSIAGVEGEHVVAVTNLISGLPAAVEAFPAALTMAEVEAAVAPFIMGGMMPTGGEEYRDRTSFGRV